MNRIFGDGMEAAPLGRDEPHPDAVAELAMLHRLWRDAYARLRSTQAKIEAPGEWAKVEGSGSVLRGLATHWRDMIHRFETAAARVVLMERSLMFRDESELPADYAPIVLAYEPGASVYVAPGFGPEHPTVRFHPDSPSLLPSATAEEALP